MLKLFLLVILIAACLYSQASEEENAARLFLYKSSKSEPVVEGANFTITYQVINNGDATATNIEIVDRYDPISFEITSTANTEGNVFFSLSELNPGEIHSFNVTVQPKLFGVYESTRARIKYNTGIVPLDDEEEEDIRMGSSTSLGRIKILSKAEHARNTSSTVLQWGFFSLVIGGLIVFSTLNYLKYSAMMKKYTVKRK